MKAKLIFEDIEDGIKVSFENVIADRPTLAQKTAMALFVQVREIIEGINANTKRKTG